MAIQPSRFTAQASIRTLGVVLALAWASFVLGQDVKDVAPLVVKVDPCVVTITVDDQSEGSGFVVDAKGLIVTNYHVIEGAKSATVIFANQNRFRVDGFVAVSPTKDLALLRINPRDKELPSLRLAGTPPAKGERVFAFGAPMGLSGSVSDGIVAAIRPGLEVRDTLQKLAHRDIYSDALGYDMDAQWIQSTAPISPGNSGGPLVNAQGEVVGVNTWVCAIGQNLNFSLSAAHLRSLLATAGTSVQTLASLPPPRAGRTERRKGDAEKTFTLWKQLNKLKNEINGTTTACEKKLQQIVPSDPRNAMKGLNSRNKRKSSVYEQMAKLYGDYAGKVKSLDSVGVDSEVTLLSVAEADVAQRIGDTCQQLSAAFATQSDHGIWQGEWQLQNLKRDMTNLRTVRDLLRIELTRKYDKQFPSLEEIATAEAGSDADNPEKNEGAANAASVGRNSESHSAEIDKHSILRAWTDRSGQHQIQAKYLGMADGKVKLEKADGTVILVSLATLSEADQRFIGVTP
jgi:S1-C subfamily serine protease